MKKILNLIEEYIYLCISFEEVWNNVYTPTSVHIFLQIWPSPLSWGKPLYPLNQDLDRYEDSELLVLDVTTPMFHLYIPYIDIDT